MNFVQLPQNDEYSWLYRTPIWKKVVIDFYTQTFILVQVTNQILRTKLKPPKEELN